MKVSDMVGRRFGRLVVLAETEKRTDRRRRWLCACDCGNTTATDTTKLATGNTRSCGCLHRDAARARQLQHGGKGTRLYNIWKNARQRCRNPRTPDFYLYGERGIRFSPVWDDFGAFRAWALSNGYRDDLTLDRIDPDGDYCPENCRWATWKEQRHNQRRCREVMP